MLRCTNLRRACCYTDFVAIRVVVVDIVGASVITATSFIVLDIVVAFVDTLAVVNAFVVHVSLLPLHV